MRARMGIRAFVTRADADQLSEFARRDGVEVRVEKDVDCLAEMLPLGGRWRLKMAAGLDEVLRADLLIHEIAHRYTRSGMTAVCSPAFHWWWQGRDEQSADRWSAHFRIPTGPLVLLLSRQPSWDELCAICDVPEGLLLLKLHLLGRTAIGQPLPPGLPVETPATLASETLRVDFRQVNGFQWQLGVRRQATGERWIWKCAVDPARLTAAHEELAWDLVGWSEARFWRRWASRLEPLPDPRFVRWQGFRPLRPKPRSAARHAAPQRPG